jgi:hypothetical protein
MSARKRFHTVAAADAVVVVVVVVVRRQETTCSRAAEHLTMNGKRQKAH